MAYSLTMKLAVPVAAGVLAGSILLACGSDDDNGGSGNTGGMAATGGSAGAGTGGSSGSGTGGSNTGGSATGGSAGAGTGGGTGELYTCEARVAMNNPNPAGSAAAGTDCCGGLGTCTDPASLSSDPTAYAYGHDDCSETLSCAPKPVSMFIDGGVLPSCTTTIGSVELEGRCTPKCFVLGDPRAPNLNAGDCPATFEGEEVLCTPCYSPIDGEATEVCSRDGDAPVEPAPTPFATCGRFPAASDGGPGGEPAGVCVPTELIEQSGAPVEALPQDTCATGELCAPINKVNDINTCFTKCTFSAAGGAFVGEGACVAPYLVEATMTGAADLLDPAAMCAEGEECAPCINPTNNEVTGACDN